MPHERFKIVSEEPLVVQGGIYMPYKYYVGPIVHKFLTELRDNKRILGIRCPECRITYATPRATCGRCFSKLQEWVELEPKGTLSSYTFAYYPLKVHPVKEPIGYGIIKLKGADTGLLHMIGEVDPSKAKVGMKMEAVFKEKREGNILDIKYFKPMI